MGSLSLILSLSLSLSLSPSPSLFPHLRHFQIQAHGKAHAQYPQPINSHKAANFFERIPFVIFTSSTHCLTSMTIQAQ